MTDKPKPTGAEYVCVPREPTIEKLSDVAKSIGNTASNPNYLERAKRCWSAMISPENNEHAPQGVEAASPRPAPDAGVIERAKHLVELVECQVTRDGEIDEADKQELIVRIAGLLKGADSGDAGKMRPGKKEWLIICSEMQSRFGYDEKSKQNVYAACIKAYEIAREALALPASIPAPVVDREAVTKQIEEIIRHEMRDADGDILYSGCVNVGYIYPEEAAEKIVADIAAQVLALLPAGTAGKEK